MNSYLNIAEVTTGFNDIIKDRYPNIKDRFPKAHHTWAFHFGFGDGDVIVRPPDGKFEMCTHCPGGKLDDYDFRAALNMLIETLDNWDKQ